MDKVLFRKHESEPKLLEPRSEAKKAEAAKDRGGGSGGGGGSAPAGGEGAWDELAEKAAPGAAAAALASLWAASVIGAADRPPRVPATSRQAEEAT